MTLCSTSDHVSSAQRPPHPNNAHNWLSLMPVLLGRTAPSTRSTSTRTASPRPGRRHWPVVDSVIRPCRTFLPTCVSPRCSPHEAHCRTRRCCGCAPTLPRSLLAKHRRLSDPLSFDDSSRGTRNAARFRPGHGLGVQHGADHPGLALQPHQGGRRHRTCHSGQRRYVTERSRLERWWIPHLLQTSLVFL